MSDATIIAILTGAVALLGTWFTSWTSNKKTKVDLMVAVDGRVKFLMEQQQRDIDALREEIVEVKRREVRIVRLLRQTLIRLGDFDERFVEQLREENPDLDL